MGVPPLLDVEPTTGCNKTCLKCFQNFNPPQIKQMDFQFTCDLLTEFAEKGGESLKLTYRGEPLLYPQFIDVVSFAKIAMHIPRVVFNTNAFYLSLEMSKKLINIGVDEIICSVDSCRENMYETLQGHGFHIVIRNIFQITILKQLYGKKKPVITIKACKNEYNKEEMESGEFQEFWKNYDVKVVIDDQYDLSDWSEDATVLDNFCCEELWKRLVVLVDGTVLPCCAAYNYNTNEAYSVGNAKTHSLEDIWSSKKIKRLRSLHKEGKSHRIEMCKRCRGRKAVING